MRTALDLTSTAFFEEILSRVEPRRERWKLKIGKLFFPSQTNRWLRYVHAHPHLFSQISHFPKLLTKIYRPYVSRVFNCQSRVDHLIEHYELVEQLKLSPLISQALNHELVLADLQGATHHALKVVLGAVRHGHREGEIEFQLKWQDAIIFSMTCSLMATSSSLALKIAKVQGSADSGAKEAIKSATKACFGARPQTVLLQVAQAFGEAVGCQEIILIGNQNRVSLNPMRRRKITSNYDALWLEHGASPNQTGDFSLPTAVQRQVDLSDVPSNKRSQYRKRYELFNALQAQVRQCVAEHASTHDARRTAPSGAIRPSSST
jgi:uncharacterized protein VirK/YbjX